MADLIPDGIVTESRDVVFVSHANPEDNEFTVWLTLKLASLGYRAWSDVTRLLGGEDFWRDIERAIRDRTAKFLYVLSRTSNHKEGSLLELKVANDVRKKGPFADFIIPLRVDDLPFGDVNIQMASLNAIDFCEGWAPGLKQLVAKLEKDNVPKNPAFGPDAVRQWWQGAFNVEAGTTAADEAHLSNWFSIQLPLTVYTHTLIGLIDGAEPMFPFPAKFRYGLVTFAPAVDLVPFLGTLRIQSTTSVPLRDFMVDEDWNRQRENRDIITYFVNEAWKLAVAPRLEAYAMAGGRIAFYFDATKLPEPDVKFVGVAGRPARRALMGYKTTAKGKRHWHFAVSARASVHPTPILMLRTHVLFSDDGVELWRSGDAMHRARRGQCKNWWNDDWRDRLLAAATWLSGGEPSVRLPLGLSVCGTMNIRPLEFISPVTLNEGAKEAEAASDADVGDDDDGDPEAEEGA